MQHTLVNYVSMCVCYMLMLGNASEWGCHFFHVSHIALSIVNPGELVLVTGLFTCYTHVYMKVLNCGRLMIRVVLVLHVYIRGIRTWEYLEFCFPAFMVCYIWGIVGLQ
jgi:hypothetical protein